MPSVFTRYQKFVVAVLAFLQFTIILDFMIMAPLGALLMRELHIPTRQFGLVVSAYAFSAGALGPAGRRLRRQVRPQAAAAVLLRRVRAGHLAVRRGGQLRFLLGRASSPGVFGGVIGSIIMAIIADLFPLEVRGRVMGTVQTSFAASQVLGLPLGLFLSNHWGWHAPFLMIAAGGRAGRRGHRGPHAARSTSTSSCRGAERGAAPASRRSTQAALPAGVPATMLLATGGFMLMPFGSAFTVNNLGIPLEQLPWIYMGTGR